MTMPNKDKQPWLQKKSTACNTISVAGPYITNVVNASCERLKGN